MENNDKELEVMREQLATLNKKLEDQAIVNDKLMRNAMKNKMSWIKKLVWAEIIAVPFFILIFFSFAAGFGISFTPIIVLSIILIASVCLDYKINKIGEGDLFTGNLKETAVKLTKMKKYRLRSEIGQTILCLIIMFWIGYDIFIHIPATGILKGAVIAGLIGGAIGAVSGIIASIYLIRKMQRTNDEIIQQINELTEE